MTSHHDAIESGWQPNILEWNPCYTRKLGIDKCLRLREALDYRTISIGEITSISDVRLAYREEE